MDKLKGSQFRELYDRRDDEYWNELKCWLDSGDLELSEMLINYPAFIRRREMTRLLADYDLFRHIIDLPGSIAELGVYIGAGIFTWTKLLETFVPGDRSRKVFGFESEHGYKNFAEQDGDPRPWIDGVVGQKVPPENLLERMTKLTNLDAVLPGIDRVSVIKGDIEHTIPEFVASSQGTRFSLIYFDVNLYKPTLVGLRNLYPLLIPGGIVAFNGYGSPPWQGESRAIEDYFGEVGIKQPRLRKFPYSIHPSGFFFKD